MRALLQHRKSVFVLSLVLLMALLAIVRYVVHIDGETRLANEREMVDAQLDELRNRFEYEINTTLNLTMGGLIYVTYNPDISQQQFARLAEKIHERAPYIRNFGLARDNVISHIYPYEGNEAALGFDYMATSEQRAAVLKAIRARQTVIAGPVDLVQGGKGFISRVPIFLGQDASSYWGMSSIVVMVDDLLQKVGLQEFTEELNIALRGSDARGLDGDVFYGDSTLYEASNSVMSTIHLPNGSWVIAAEPRLGWQADNQRHYQILFFGTVLAMLITTLVYFLLMNNIKLKEKEQKVIEAGEHKSRFFTQMTHELRTPLTAIHGAIRLLENSALPADKAIALIKNAERNSQRLIWLINDILDMKKLESGRLEYNMSCYEIRTIMQDALDEVEHYADQFMVKLEYRDEVGTPVMINADRMRIQQVMINLLTNAIKNSPQASKVIIELERCESGIRVSVVDQGSGIDNSRIATIFNEFGQSDDANQASHKIVASTGLGLSISKQLVEGHNGRIGCYNREQAGAVFYFELPMAEGVCDLAEERAVG
ncbi:MAG: CHASE domain-containing protein [Gammaproteobacteria bacterium]|nr:CHASE domain-containing protein [Gammaproteobacteria bacterium]